MTDQDSFDQWAIVDVMGHQRYIGHVTEQVIAGTGFVRVDVPAFTREGRQLVPGWTKLIGTGSIYAISPVTEEIARAMVAERNDAPISAYDMPKICQPAIESTPLPELEDMIDINDYPMGDDGPF